MIRCRNYWSETVNDNNRLGNDDHKILNETYASTKIHLKTSIPKIIYSCIKMNVLANFSPDDRYNID